MSRPSTETRPPMREPVHTATRERKRTRKAGISPYDLDPSIIPDGMSYEFKRYSNVGQQDVSHQMGLQANGWEPVPASRHPGLMPPDYPPNSPILIGDQMLMDRPMELTLEARAEVERDTRETMQANQRRMQEVPEGTTAPRTAARLASSYAPVDVPE